MTIQEAIKSGKPFRIKSEYHDGSWLIYDTYKNNFFRWWTYERRVGKSVTLYPSDILATDWEVEE